jgi:hypothetical protein
LVNSSAADTAKELLQRVQISCAFVSNTPHIFQDVLSSIHPRAGGLCSHASTIFWACRWKVKLNIQSTVALFLEQNSFVIGNVCLVKF